MEILAVHKDYAETNVRTRHWKSADETQYTLSVIQGPAAASHTGTAWAQFLRRVTTCMCFRVLSAQLVTNDAACKIPEDEWLRMYPYITRKCDPAKSGSYMTAAAMLVMLGRNDKEIANASSVGKIRKSIKNRLACDINTKPYVRKDADVLSAKFRTDTTILVIDLMFRVGTAQLANDIGMGLADMGWETVLFKIHESEGEKPLERLANALEKASELVKAKKEEGGVTVHLWLSMQFAMEVKPPHLLLTGANFVETIVREIYHLDCDATRPIFVVICPHSKFNCVEGRIERLAKEIETALREKGILVSTAPHMWRGMYSVWASVPNFEEGPRYFTWKGSDMVGD